MIKSEDLDHLRALLRTATSEVPGEYFMLPVADTQGGEPLVIYRERVYAYELYHRLRLVWPSWPYSLGGEVDKRGHPLVRGAVLDSVKPDLLAHEPGTMDNNLAVVEIKAVGPTPSQAERTAIETDLRKLGAFLTSAKYDLGILLVFGDDIVRIREHVQWAVSRGASLDGLELWHHRRAGEEGVCVQWGSGGV